MFPRCTPESCGISSSLLKEVMQELDRMEYMKSIIILRKGKIIAESYWAPYGPETPTALWSLSKSFTSCAIGVARREKRLELDDKLIDFFPEYRSCVTDEKMFDVTLRDLLTMRSGHGQCAFNHAWLDTAGDWVRGFLSSPLPHKPGTYFAYNSLGTYMLSAVIRRVTGENLRDYLMPRLFLPLEIQPGPWDSCPAGTNYGGFGLHLKPMDLAKFTQLILDRGIWQGRQILPADYLDEALKPHADNSMNEHPDWRCGYGYQFWCSRHGFRGDGACGQYAVILPEKEMAIAVNGSMSEMGRTLDLFWEKLLPGIQDQALEENNAALSELESFCRSAAIPPAPVTTKVEMKTRTFEFLPNAAKIEGGTLSFDADKCVLALKTPRGVEKIKAGFGKFEKSFAQLQDFRPHHFGACASWKDEKSLEIRVLHLDGTFRDTWLITFEEGKMEFQWETKCSLFRPLMPPLKVAKCN